MPLIWLKTEKCAAAIERVLGEGTDPLHLPEHGVIGGPAQARVRRDAVERVVRPCLDALLAG